MKEDAKNLRMTLTYFPSSGRWRWNNGKRAGKIAGHRDPVLRYWRVWWDGKQHYGHRLAWLYMTGEWPRGEIDHKNLDRTDDRWRNIRETTRSGNMVNRSSRNRWGFKGVRFWGKSYCFQLTREGKAYYASGFKTATAANAAYLALSRRLSGEFAR